MLGRKSYPREEIDNGRAAMAADLSAYQSRASATDVGPVGKALALIEPTFFNNLALALDRRYLHRHHAGPVHTASCVSHVALFDGGGVMPGPHHARAQLLHLAQR